jgi:hypothetical protein
MDIKTLQLLTQVHRLLGTSHAGERENACAKIIKILSSHGFTWNDLPTLLHAAEAMDSQSATNGNARRSAVEPSAPLPLVRLTTALGKYLHLQEYEYLTVGLWIAHTFVYRRFMVSPRLVLASPVRRCGKTTALSLLAALCHYGERFDGLTPAVIYRLVNSGEVSLLCDRRIPIACTKTICCAACSTLGIATAAVSHARLEMV